MEPKEFKEVLKEEIDEIGSSRDLRKTEINGLELPPVSNSDDAFQKAIESKLLGLSFSGGGIRSATFNLGILQGLAHYKLLPRFDYLSTVSGGGYIGSWLTTWTKRLGLKAVTDSLGRVTEEAREHEPDEIQYLRKFSNYLTPRLGLLNADSLTTAAIYTRNLLLNLTILVAALGAMMLLPRILNILDSALESAAGSLTFGSVIFPFALLTLIVFFFIFRNLTNLGPSADTIKWYLKQGSIQWVIVLPSLLAAWLIAISLYAHAPTWQQPGWVLYVALGISVINAAMQTAVVIISHPALIRYWYRLVYRFFFVFISVAVAGTLVWQVAEPFSTLADDTRTILGVPLLLSIMTLGGILYIGLMGQDYRTSTREWWGRLGAWVMIYGLGYLVVFAISIYGGPCLTWLNEKVGSWLNQVLASGWILTTIGGLLAGKKTGEVQKDTNIFLKILIKIVPYIFILGLALLLAYGIESIMPSKNLSILHQVRNLFGLFAALVIAAMLMSWRVNINEFSMHNYYRNRLVRCYIGASDRNRRPNPFTGFDMRQHNVRISDLTTADPNDPATEKSVIEKDRIEEADLGKPYAGPYYLVNTTLNLVAGDNLAWQQRKASSFIFGPLYSGYEVWEESKKQSLKNLADKGFRPTAGYKDGLSLGTAMAVSGAAVNPNMGHFSSPAVSFLMTIFNVRLGIWLGNPRHQNSWPISGPIAGLAYLFFELFGMTNDQRRFVNLSDGGHFENLGLYELVRRRCRFIIVGDGGQDIELKFGELGGVIEKCRTDFDIDIDINVDPLRLKPNSTWNGQHCVLGTICYDKADRRKDGILLYIKSSLTGDEPTDVLSYAAQNSDFPNQSTADQWFDESQFESYRALGEHIIKSIFEKIDSSQPVSSMKTGKLFEELQGHWGKKGSDDPYPLF
jgi:hypothetical protein